MTKVVLQMAALCFEHVVVFVFDLSTSTGRRHKSGDVLGADVLVGNPRVLISFLAFMVDNLEFQSAIL